MIVPATPIAVETLLYPTADFEGFRDGQRESFVHEPNVRLNAQKSHRFAEAFVARWLRREQKANVWAGTVALFAKGTARHVCTKEVVERLVRFFGRERVERLRVSSPRLVTPDVIACLPNGAWRFIEVKRASDRSARDEQLRALAYLQWLELGSCRIVRLLPEGSQPVSGTASVEAFSVTAP